MAATPDNPFKCAGCGAPWVGDGKCCDCPTGVLFRDVGSTFEFDGKDKAMGMYSMFEDRENEVFDTLVTALREVANPVCDNSCHLQKIASDALSGVGCDPLLTMNAVGAPKRSSAGPGVTPRSGKRVGRYPEPAKPRPPGDL